MFKKREDLLAAAFWSRIDYLSSMVLFVFLEKIILKSSSNFGDYQRLQFWPGFYIGYRVESDVIFKFEKAGLLIEVKPPNGVIQNYKQWVNKIKSYIGKAEENKKLYFLALGSLPYEAKQWQHELSQRYPHVSLSFS